MKQAVTSDFERPVTGLVTGGAPDEYVDLVETSPVDEDRGGMTVDVIEPPALQWKSLVGQIDNTWRDICLSCKPRFHGVPVR